MKFLVIDDERTFSGNGLQSVYGESIAEADLVYARTSDEGLLAIAKHCVDYTLHYGDEIVLYLDHDLGGSDTILPVINFLVSVKVPGIARIRIHSQNPVSADYVNVLKRAGYLCKKISLPELKEV